VKKYLLLGVSALFTLGIFAMSLRVGTESAALSSPLTAAVETVLKGIFPHYDLAFDVLHEIVRKLAHVIEYAALGISYMMSAFAWRHRLWPVFLAGGLVAFADEGLQAFVPDRGPSFLDAVCFDVPGFVIGACAVILLYHLIRRKKVVSKDVS